MNEKRQRERVRRSPNQGGKEGRNRDERYSRERGERSREEIERRDI
jgi:hypothetical protein